MKAITILDKFNIDLREFEKPAPGVGQVLVQMKCAAICTVDQRAYSGATKSRGPQVGGHEGSGIVVAVGPDVEETKVGDHVSVGRSSCGVCENCRLGVGHCMNGFKRMMKQPPATEERPFGLEGTFAQYVVRKESDLYILPPETPFEQGALLEPLSDVVRSIKRSRLRLGETCVVLGAGIMGLLHVQLARGIGARVIVSELDAVRREKAKAAGADYVIDPAETDPVQFVKDLTKGRGVDVVFFAIPVSKMFEQSYSMICRAGRVVVYSNQIPDDPYPLKLGALHNAENEIIGTNGSSQDDFYVALEMLAYGRVDLSQVISKTFPISRYKEAFDTAITPGSYRIVVLMDQE